MHNDSHGLIQTIVTDATAKDYSTALADAIGHLMKTGKQEATLCVPHFVQGGHPWVLRRSDDGDGYTAERYPSDDHSDPTRGVLVLDVDGDLEPVAADMLAHDKSHPFCVDWTRREALALAA